MPTFKVFKTSEKEFLKEFPSLSANLMNDKNESLLKNYFPSNIKWFHLRQKKFLCSNMQLND